MAQSEKIGIGKETGVVDRAAVVLHLDESVVFV